MSPASTAAAPRASRLSSALAAFPLQTGSPPPAPLPPSLPGSHSLALSPAASAPGSRSLLAASRSPRPPGPSAASRGASRRLCPAGRALRAAQPRSGSDWGRCYARQASRAPRPAGGFGCAAGLGTGLSVLLASPSGDSPALRVARVPRRIGRLGKEPSVSCACGVSADMTARRTCLPPLLVPLVLGAGLLAAAQGKEAAGRGHGRALRGGPPAHAGVCLGRAGDRVAGICGCSGKAVPRASLHAPPAPPPPAFPLAGAEANAAVLGAERWRRKGADRAGLPRAGWRLLSTELRALRLGRRGWLPGLCLDPGQLGKRCGRGRPRKFGLSGGLGYRRQTGQLAGSPHSWSGSLFLPPPLLRPQGAEDLLVSGRPRLLPALRSLQVGRSWRGAWRPGGVPPQMCSRSRGPPARCAGKGLPGSLLGLELRELDFLLEMSSGMFSPK